MRSFLKFLAQGRPSLTSKPLGGQSAVAGTGSFIVQSRRDTYVQSGAVPQSEIDVRFMGTSDADCIVFFVPFEDNSIYSIPVSIDICNYSYILAKDVELFIDIPIGLYKGNAVHRSAGKIAEIRNIVNTSDYLDNGARESVYYRIGAIPQKTSFDIGDFIFIDRPTKDMRFDVEAKTADNYVVNVGVLISVELVVEISVIGANFDPVKKTFHLQFRRKFDGEIDPYLQNEFLSEIMEKNDREHKKYLMLEMVENGEEPSFREVRQFYRDILRKGGSAYRKFIDDLYKQTGRKINIKEAIEKVKSISMSKVIQTYSTNHRIVDVGYQKKAER